MKFNCGPTHEEKQELRKIEEAKLKEWHPFFAVTPKRVGSYDCRFLEWIERKGETYIGYQVSPCFPYAFKVTKWRWEYRAKGGQG